MNFKSSQPLLHPSETNPTNARIFNRGGGGYQPVKSDDDEDDSSLTFVGTSTELVSPTFYKHHHHRSPHQAPSTFGHKHHHRQGAGKDVKTPTTAAATAASTKSTPKGVATDDQLTKVIGILYFMSWTRKTLKNYSSDIRKLYEIPLTDRCFGKFDENKSTEESFDVSDSRTAAKEAARKLEKGYDVAENFTDLALIQKRIADAIANPELDLLENRVETPRHLVTPIELACLSRLRTMVKMSGSWLKKTVDMEVWMEKNQKTLIQHASEVSHGLEFAVSAFNAVCVLGEIYGLESVDRKSVKKDFIRYLEQYERPKLEEYNQILEIPDQMKAIEYVAKLEAKLNCHRTILHIIGSSTISIFQIILKSVPIEILETTTRSLREIGHKLPAAFRFYDDLKLSPFALRFLAASPPNSIEFSMGELDDQQRHSTATTTEASTPKTNNNASARTAGASTQKSKSTTEKGKSDRNASLKSDPTQKSHSVKSPEVFSAQSNSTQKSTASQKSPPTARNSSNKKSPPTARN